jgi:hypothetical protein
LRFVLCDVSAADGADAVRPQLRLELLAAELDSSHQRVGGLALTSDVTGRNIFAVTSTTNWLFVEAIDTLKLSVPWDTAHFQAVLAQLRVDGFHLFEAGITDFNTVLARGLRPRPQ